MSIEAAGVPEFPDDDEPRFWWMYSDTSIGHPHGMIGVVDEDRGGIIAWADSLEQAEALIDQLNR